MNKEAKFLDYILREIVDNPDGLRIEQTEDKKGVVLTVHVAQEDMGKIIGRSGKMGQAIRAIMHAYGGKNQARIGVIIHDPKRDGVE